jgi:hypothetical protein
MLCLGGGRVVLRSLLSTDLFSSLQTCCRSVYRTGALLLSHFGRQVVQLPPYTL